MDDAQCLIDSLPDRLTKLRVRVYRFSCPHDDVVEYALLRLDAVRHLFGSDPGHAECCAALEAWSNGAQTYGTYDRIMDMQLACRTSSQLPAHAAARQALSWAATVVLRMNDFGSWTHAVTMVDWNVDKALELEAQAKGSG